MDSQFKVGTLVENPNCPEWGPGKIVSVTTKYHVVFRDFECTTSEDRMRAKRFNLDFVFSICPEQNDIILDNLSQLTDTNNILKFRAERWTITRLIDRFISIFPLGFYDEKYYTMEDVAAETPKFLKRPKANLTRFFLSRASRASFFP